MLDETGEAHKSSHSQMFFTIGVLKTPVLEFIFNKVVAPVAEGLQHRCFPVIIAKFLRTVFFIEHLHCLLLGTAINREITS